MVQVAEDELSRAVIKLMLEEPFYAHFLGKVTRIISKDVTKTAAVGIRNKAICLFVNPDFFLNELKTIEERIAVLKHEVLHLVFKHLFRHQENWHPRTANIAADLSVNQFVYPWPLPEGAVLLDQFSVLNLAAEENMEYYYEKLLEAKQAAPQKIEDLQNELGHQQGDPGIGDKMGDEEIALGLDGTGLTDDEQAESDTGQDDGENNPGEDQPPGANQGVASTKSPKELAKELSDWERIREILKEPESAKGGIISPPPPPGALVSPGSGSGGGGKVWMDDHDKWAPGDEEEENKIDGLIADSAERTKDHGSMPGWLSKLINAILEKRKPQIDWKRSLRLFANNSRRTRVVGTMKRFSKRFGEPSPGIRIKSFQKMAIIIDTSGSVVDDDLSLFFSEIHGMWKNGAEITVIECDAAVQRTYPYRGKLPKGVAGRGGTVFDPAFQYLRDQSRRQIFDGCIYLTDGYAEPPTIKPPCKLLWIITSGGTVENVAFGQAVQLQH